MTSPKPLSGKQARHLRALAHHLKPIVQIGKNGWTEALSAQIEQALLDHELIKIKVGGECPTDRKEIAEKLSSHLDAIVAQSIGTLLVVYKAHPEKPKIQLPR